MGPWQPETKAKGVAELVALLALHGVDSLEGLRGVPAAKLNWPIPTGGYAISQRPFIVQYGGDIRLCVRVRR